MQTRACNMSPQHVHGASCAKMKARPLHSVRIQASRRRDLYEILRTATTQNGKFPALHIENSHNSERKFPCSAYSQLRSKDTAHSITHSLHTPTHERMRTYTTFIYVQVSAGIEGYPKGLAMSTPAQNTMASVINRHRVSVSEYLVS